MKSKTSLMILGLFSCLNLAHVSSAFAAGDTGSGGVGGGGGVTLDAKDIAKLRDLVDPTACTLQWAKDFQKETAPGSIDIINQIKVAHWYFGNAYEREINHIIVCKTSGPLKKINVTDPDSLAVFPPPGEKVNEKQAAIRMGQFIVVDMTELNKMTLARHKDFLFVHEVTHSFLPMGVPARNDKLRAIIKNLAIKISPESLELNILANGIDMPPKVSILDPLKNDVLMAIDENGPLRDRMLAAKKITFRYDSLQLRDKKTVDQLIVAFQNYDPKRDNRHPVYISNNAPWLLVNLSNKIKEAFSAGNVEVVKAYYTDNHLGFNFGFCDFSSQYGTGNCGAETLYSLLAEKSNLEMLKAFSTDKKFDVGPLELSMAIDRLWTSDDLRCEFCYRTDSASVETLKLFTAAYIQRHGTVGLDKIQRYGEMGGVNNQIVIEQGNNGRKIIETICSVAKVNAFTCFFKY